MSLWYPSSAMRHIKKPVKVRWGWVDRPFEAVLIEDKPRRWAAVIRDRKTGAPIDLLVLPPKRVKGGFLEQRTTDEMVPISASQFERWGPEPDAWQPIGVWPDPLPDPLPVVGVKDEIRMRSIGTVSFDAASAAAEMEADRNDARDGLHQAEVEDRRSLAWWRDASRILYQPIGEVTREMAEGRIMRAASWCGAGSGLSRGSLAMSSFLAKMAAMTLSQALAAQEELIDKAVRFDPLRQDHEDFLTAMEWFAKLGETSTYGLQRMWTLSRPQEVLLYRALTVPLSFADIGRQKAFKVSGTRARAIYESTIDRVHRIANASARIDPVIMRVRERNRAARRERQWII